MLPITLFLLGVVFLFLGWRWQSPSNEEAKTALRGLEYMKRELMQVQDQVLVLKNKLQRSEQIKFEEELRKEELKERECKGKNNLYVLNAQELGQSSGRLEKSPLGEEPLMPNIDHKVQPQSKISSKYQEVLEFAEQGQSIPEIAKCLLLSQDAVMMVLRTQQKGGTQ